jgi:hypothetical protein
MVNRAQRQLNSDLRKGAAAVNDLNKFAEKEIAMITSFSPERGVYQVVALGNSSSPGIKGARGPFEADVKMGSPLTTAPYPIGTYVLLDCKTGKGPKIECAINFDSISMDSLNRLGVSILPEAQMSSTALTPTGFISRTAYAPVDALPGDWITVGPDGNCVGVLLGGYSILGTLDAGKARFETHQLGDVARVVAENYEVFTGFGELKIHNKEGRNGLSFRGAIDQLDESGGGEEQWTFKLDIGAPDQYFRMEVCDPDGTTKALVGITSSGGITIQGANGISLVDSSSTYSHMDLNALSTRILTTVLEEVGGPAAYKFGSTRSTKISGTDNRITGADDSENIGGSKNSIISGSMRQTIGAGNPATAKPINVGLEQHVVNGSWIMEVGSPKKGANPAAMPGIQIVAHNGDIVIGASPKLPATRTSVTLNTMSQASGGMGGSIGLGLPPTQCIFSGTLYEPFKAFADALMLWLDTHTHPTPAGPSSVAALPSNTVLPALVPLVQSKVVKMGG